MNARQIENKYYKALDILYDLEDNLCYTCHKLGRLITELQQIDVKKAYANVDKVISRQKSCDECDLTISSYLYKKNKGLCNQCVRAR